MIGQNGTYLFRPVCYDSPENCFMPRRLQHKWKPEDQRRVCDVLEFPDSDPVEIVRIEKWTTDEEINAQVSERIKQMEATRCEPDDDKLDLDNFSFDGFKFHTGWNKQRWIKIGKPCGLKAKELAAMKIEDIRRVVLKAQAEQRLPDELYDLYVLVYSRLKGEGILRPDPWEQAWKLSNSIQYKVIYKNREILYLSDLEHAENTSVENRQIVRIQDRELAESPSRSAPVDRNDPINQRQAAIYLKVHVSTVRRWQNDSLIRVHKINRTCKYYKNELDEDVKRSRLKK